VLRTRLATAAIALPAIWLVVWRLPQDLFAGFMGGITALGLYEYFAMALPAHRSERIAGIFWGLVVAAGVMSGRPGVWGAAIAFAVITGFAFTLLRHDDLTGAVQRLGASILGILYLGFFTPHLVLTRANYGANGWRWALFAVFVAMGSDTGGYFSGRAWGRTKLLPPVSPSKTVEGALGAVWGAVAIALFCRWAFFPSMRFTEAIWLGGAVSILAQFGDLAESALKRAFGAKDSGWIIPGHGGILDRLDSLLFPFVFVYYYAALPRG
jgi:phosphatidate cytidylyltransferase